MNKFPLIGVGITTKGKSGKTLDAHFPFILFQNGENKFDKHFQQCNDLMKNDLMHIENINLLEVDDEEFNNSFSNLETNKIIALCRISEDKPINSIEEAYLKLHLISYKFFLPNSLNLENLFDNLENVAWTNQGPIEVEGIEKEILLAKRTNQSLEIKSVDKFPPLTDYIIPPGVRIADASRVRLGAYLSEGTTVMHEGFVNFNAGTLGAAMIEGRISAGVLVGKNSDLGGGCSTMGTLSGGNNIKISIGKNCLLGANSGLGIPIGDNCIIEAGLYITGGSKVTRFSKNNEPESIVKASQLAGEDNLLFIRNSQSGAIEARINPKSIALNETLHKN
jgi:2,3,4,5-tetrahydropyridine-2-carboxylate N-succinyltransferase